MADIGLQPCYDIPAFSTPTYADTKVSRGNLDCRTVNVVDEQQNINYRGTPVNRGGISGSTVNVIDQKYDLPYRGSPVNYGILPSTINGVPPSSIDLKKLTQLWS